MKTFIKADSIRKKPNINQYKIDQLIGLFNKQITKFPISGLYTLNDGLDEGCPRLNEYELKVAVKMADEMGWVLTVMDDNYQTVTYRLKMKM